MDKKRPLDVAIISDLHLGTFGSQAKSIVSYLKSIKPEILVLNGDIIDIWQFSKHYFPESHMQVIKEIFSMLAHGTKVYYITGNHDEVLRKYSDLQLGNLTLTDKLVIEIDGKKTWVFHGDIFDASTKGWTRFLAKLGGKGYDILILLNQLINWFLKIIGEEKMSFSKKVKNGVKKAVSWIQNFETIAADLAIEKGYDYVACGHIHQPQIKTYTNNRGSVIYLNSGDWVEHCTALEYTAGKWNIHNHIMDSDSNVVIVKSERSVPLPDLISETINLLLKPA